MRRVAQLVLATLVAQTASGFFVPQRHYSGSFKLGVVLSSQTAARDVGVKIFDDENAVRTAYDDWRLEFAKGAFDDNRYEQFKQNFKILTTANLEAIEKAVGAGTNPPGWMYLNEFGDFSQAEYDAMAIESDVDTYKVYEDWCEEFGVKAEANRYEIFLANYKSMKSYAKKTGKNLKLNKFADWTKSEAEKGSKEEPKPVAQPQNAKPATATTVEPAADEKMKEFIQQRGTRVLQYANGISSVEKTAAPRATIAIAAQSYTSDILGTRPVTPTTQDQGTRRVGGAEPVANQPTHGTKLVPAAGTMSIANQSFQGTRQITSVSGSGQGTRVIQPAGASESASANQPFQGTRAIPPSAPNGTGQVFQGTRSIQPATPNGAGPGVAGTRAIQPSSPSQSFQGTRQIPSTGINGVTQGTRAISPTNGNQPFQGTRAIQSTGHNGASQPFQGTRQISSVNGASAQGTKSIQPAQPAGEQLFQGTRRISDFAPERPFRGTIPLDQSPSDT